MKWIGLARIYDKSSGHFVCKRRVYVRQDHNRFNAIGEQNPLYVLRFNTEEGYNYKRVDENFDLEFSMECNSVK